MQETKQIKLAVFDWAGTTVDYGSSAPMVVFEQTFAEAGIQLTRSEINGPMGMEKKAHIRALLSLDTAKAQWKEKYGTDWDEQDVERLYQNFETRLFEVIAQYSKPLAGVVDTVEQLRQMGIQIGSTTGYTSQMMERVIPGAAEAGYRPDCVITPDVTGIGRPTPFMLYECMRRLNVYPPSAVVKVGDTVTDILEGKNAGAWSIGILTGSNLLGLTEAEYLAMDAEELKNRKEQTKQKYLSAGADLVIDSFAELPQAVRQLEQMMAKEEI